MPVYGKFLSYGDVLDDAFKIREKVFVEELNVPFNIEFDDLDRESIHVMVIDNIDHNSYVATGRMHYNGEYCRIGHIAVLKEFRGRYYGDLAVRMLINRAFTSGIDEVWTEVDLVVKPFFEKIGFQIENEEFKNDESTRVNMVIRRKNFCSQCRA